jgi:phosphoenolpyruvate---glycerone phosphotransferase subunit DhaL
MITIQEVIQAVKSAGELIQIHAHYLNDLDAVVGDGEHGVNLARAFKRVQDKLPEIPKDNLGNLLKGIGRELISAGGGAGTTFYGAAFMAAGKVAGSASEVDSQMLAQMFTAALEDIRKRGGAGQGDKTLIDALEPAVVIIQEKVEAEGDIAETLRSAAECAKNGALLTKEMLGRRGRGLYAGERALGTPDPGAASTYIIFSAFAGLEPEIPL